MPARQVPHPRAGRQSFRNHPRTKRCVMHAPPLPNNLDPCRWGCHCGSLKSQHAAAAFHAAKQTKLASRPQCGHQPTFTDERSCALVQKTVLGSLSRAKATIQRVEIAGVVSWRIG
jgi:hypothetical protein